MRKVSIAARRNVSGWTRWPQKLAADLIGGRTKPMPGRESHGRAPARTGSAWIANARGFFIVEHGDRAFGVRVGGS